MDSEIIDISNENFDKEWNPSANKTPIFGSGIELFMNDKKTSQSRTNIDDDINIDDLNILECELNNLGNDEPTRSTYDNKSDFFSNSSTTNNSKPFVRFDDNGPQNIGEATASTSNENNTWDGYGKFNNIPINPDKNPQQHQPQINKEELLREKFKYLRKLETLESKGVNLTKKYSMDSPLAEMQGEYEMIMDEKSKQNSIKFQGNMLMACINGIEFLNGRFDPFDVKLDGWSDQVNENMTDYDDIFGELYEKYKSRASMGPELKLLFQLGGSAMMIHMSNTMFKSAMPGMDDILRQNPDLMRQFQTAAVNSMAPANPGFSGFVNNMMNMNQQGPSLNSGGGPPPPMATQEYATSGQRPGNNSNSSSSVGRSSFASQSQNDGIHIRETKHVNIEKTPYQPRTIPQNSRAEMKGPTDISDILSGLKTKTINIQTASHQQDNESMISLDDLKDLQSDGNMPKKSKRRQKSDKNTVSLDF